MDIQNWQADLEQLGQELPAKHKNFFHSCRPEDFHSMIKKLRADIEGLNPFELVMRLAAIVAAGRDAHTALMVPLINRLPLDIHPFDEGIYIVQAADGLEKLVNSRIVRIGKIDIARVLELFEGMIAHENRYFVLSCLPAMFPCTDILFGLGIIDRTDEVKLTIKNLSGEEKELVLRPVGYSDYHAKELRAGVIPFYRRDPEKNYWYTISDGILYAHYRSCHEMENLSVADFCEQIKNELKSGPAIKKLVLDLRHNPGGDSELLKPFLIWISENPLWNVRNKLFVVVGRDTFSSALLNVYFLFYHTKAKFCGEPTGGKPNCYGEVKYFQLNHSRLSVRYSTKYYDLVDDDDQLSFFPEAEFRVSFEDYRSGVDPCWEWILKENHNG